MTSFPWILYSGSRVKTGEIRADDQCELGGKGRKLPLSPSSPLNPKFAACITGSYIVDNKHFALMCCALCGKNAPESTAAIRNALTISAI